MRRFVSYSIFPFVMACFLFPLGWTYATVDSLLRVFALLTVLHVFTVATLEQILPRDVAVRFWRDRQMVNDVGHGLFSNLFGVSTGKALAVVFAAQLSSLLRSSGVVLVWPSGWPFLLQLLSLFLIDSVVGYWIHRAQHRFDWLWWFHAIHHDVRQMHVLKSGRTHFGEDAIGACLGFLPLLALGVPPELMVCVGAYTLFAANLAHSNVDQRFFRWMHYILPTADDHRIHHAEERHLQDSNFSGPAPFLDWLFGTFHHPQEHPVQRFGIAGSPVPPGFFSQVFFPFLVLFRLRSYSPSE